MLPLPVYQPGEPRLARDEIAQDVPFGTGERIKTTTSICPECLAKVEATVFARHGGVYMDKFCAEHGRFTALLASDPKHYYVADSAVESLVCCCGPGGCGPSSSTEESGKHVGDQVANHSCNMLIEITQSCNLTCPTCYAGSSPLNKNFMELDKFESLLDDLLDQGKGDADLIQLSGGEPTIHPQFFEFVELALAKGIQQVYVNTNAIRLAKRDFAERLASYGDRVSVYLQFDGFKASTYGLLRGRDDLLDTKIAAADHCEELGINTVPIITMTRGVNDDEIGKFLRWAAARPRSVRKVMIQPAMYSGRYENPRFVERLTVADVAKAIAEQTDGLFSEEDFTPIPCSDPNCFSMAAALRTNEGLTPISRYLPRYQDWATEANQAMIAAVADTFDSAGSLSDLLAKVMASDSLAALDEKALDELLDLVAQLPTGAAGGHESEDWNGLFAIGVKPFMDAYTYDQDRIDKCCVHIIAADGKPVSFCEYNAINRPTGNL